MTEMISITYDENISLPCVMEMNENEVIEVTRDRSNTSDRLIRL